MSGVHETAYPRLKLEFTERELIAIYSPTSAELKFVASQYRQVSQQVFLLVQLKLLQRLGYFVALSSVPTVIVEHICSRAQLRVPRKSAMLKYDQSGSRYRHHKSLREYVGIRVLDAAGETWLREQALQAAQTKQELPDIINVLIEELIQRRFELPGFTQLFRLPMEPKAFISSLSEQLKTLSREVDKRFPENGSVDIDETGLVIRRAERQKPPPELEMVDEAIRAQMNDVSILDVLTETEKWLDLHRLFGPLSGFETKVDDPRKRFITTLFCYGCNLGPTQTAKSVKGLSRKQVAWLNLKHVTEQRLDKAIMKVINAYNRFALPRYWGSGKSASADGTKWNMYEQNLLSEYHIRYGGYGGIGYYHVSDKYIALFSHFIPCGVYEAVYILDGLINNQSDIQPDTLHGDTQAQSTAPYRREHINRFGEYPLDLDREFEPINYKLDFAI